MIHQLGVKVIEKQIPELPGLLKNVSVDEVFKVLLNIYLERKQEVIKSLELEKRIEEIQIEINRMAEGFESQGAGDVKIKVYEGTELFDGPDRFML